MVLVNRFLVALMVSTSALSPVVYGVTTWKGPVTGNWNLPTNWAGDFPTSNSTVRLNHDHQTNAYTVVVDSPAITDKLWMDTYGDVPVHVRINHSGSLQLYSMRMGFKAEDRTSSFSIDGGTVQGMDPSGTAITNTAFLIGNNPGCNATMRVLNNGILSVPGSNGLIVASSKESIGQIVVSNGTMRIKDSLTLGKGPDSVAELIITGTSFVSITGALHIAKLDSGTLAPTGIVHVAGGTLECGTLNIGANGVGTFTLSEGQVRALDGGITLGQTTSTAHLNIYGGTMETIDSSVNIGHADSTGILFMTNGNLNVDGAITLGSASRSTGTLDLKGGIISSDQLIIGAAVSSSATAHLRGGELVILGSDYDSLLVSNAVLHLEQTLIKWNNPNITEWITNAVSSGAILWTNGLANGTYSTNGFDGCFTNEGSMLYWDNLDNGSSFTQSVIWVEESPYNTWTDVYLLSESNALWFADPDHDGLDNLTEFGQGGNPTNSADIEILPILRTEKQPMEYIHRQRTDPATYGLIYHLEQSTNLTSQSWTTNEFTLIGISPEIDGFKIVTNQISSDFFTNLFIRLQIELN